MFSDEKIKRTLHAKNVIFLAPSSVAKPFLAVLIHIDGTLITLITFFVKLHFLGKWSLENRGIDPRTSRMLSERSTIWASSPDDQSGFWFGSTTSSYRISRKMRIGRKWRKQRFTTSVSTKRPLFLVRVTSIHFISRNRQMWKLCQKWDSNPRPHSWTRILLLGRVPLLSLAP